MNTLKTSLDTSLYLHAIFTLFTVFKTFAIIVKYTVFEIANDLKIVILPSKVSFLMCHSFITLQIFDSFSKVQVILNFLVIRNKHSQIRTHYLVRLMFFIADCHTYIFQNSFSSFFAFINIQIINIISKYQYPISLASVSCNLLEHIMHSNVTEHLDHNNIIKYAQYGLWLKQSCETLLIKSVHHLAKTLNDRS